MSEQMVVVAGESLVDVVLDHDGDSTETPGGSPLNVAVGLARLDVPATLITQVGDDERAGVVVGHVTASGAEIVAAPTSSGRTSVATAHLDATGAARYEFELDWSLPRQELPICRALHVGSLGTLLEPGRESVRDLVEQACERELFVSFDANLRETFVDDRAEVWRQVRELGARCTLVKLSDEDAELLDPSQAPDDVARTLLEGERTDLVLLTRGPDGATAYCAGGEFSVAPRTTHVVDTVGAGDAFMAGTLAQLHDLGVLTPGTQELPADEASLTRLLAGAVEIAAITCERRGANPPRRSELPTGWPG
ncbi:fructokinase [Nocardioides scoriae]|uniref:Fructokinase n=1 Tax=Nocardioides scoriae TaxID=642780 RepID=A0A1H1SN72_9ACTN|nr:carbohydrate kinase [Nocardioides scoriae]SDS49303.1 fructokinase [Nocardioides scoriae]